MAQAKTYTSIAGALDSPAALTAASILLISSSLISAKSAASFLKAGHVVCALQAGNAVAERISTAVRPAAPSVAFRNWLHIIRFRQGFLLFIVAGLCF